MEEPELSLEQLQNLAAEQDAVEPMGPPVKMPQEAGQEGKPSEPPKPEEPPPLAESPPSQEPVASGEEGSLKQSEATSKFDKDINRANKAWQKINSEKEAIVAEREELEEMRKRINQASPKEQFLDERGLSAKDYDEIAESYSQEGNLKMAEEARKSAESARNKAEQTFSEDVDESFKAAWKQNFHDAEKSFPELGNPESAFYQQVQSLIIEKPVLSTYSRGIADAAEIVAMRSAVEKSSGLQEKIAELSRENDSLKSKLSIGGSEPAERPGDRKFGELSDEDQFRELTRMAEAADAR